ncbi:hypothetical protein ABS71_10720 [bacterium SCN 62-11]|nr:MAG: hypothetical protein ABS71_10720 [bacterium SCN 62-11]
MANWLESVPSESELQGRDDIPCDSSWWVTDMFSAPVTKIMPRTQSVPKVAPYVRPDPGSFSRVSGDQISFHTRLDPETCREGMKRLRALRPHRAMVCSIEAAGHLSVKAFDSARRLALVIDQETSDLLHKVLDSERPVVRHESRWTLCAPIRDRKGCVTGLLFAEGWAARMAPEALAHVVAWAENDQQPQKALEIRRRPGGCPAIPARELAAFLRSLSTMVTAGVPLQRALLHMASPAAPLGVLELCSTLSADLSNGCSFSKAAARHPRVFQAVHLGLLRVGENTGQLDRILGRLASYEEQRVGTFLKLRSALAYPALLIFLCLLAAVLAPPFVLEGHFQLIREMGVEAPFLTRCLMGFSSAMRTPWPYLVLAGLLPSLYFAGRRWLAKSENQLWLTEKLLTTPRVGPLLRILLQTRFARALAIQVESGANVLEAVQLSGQACGNPLMSRYSEQICKSIYQGKGLASSFRVTGLFTPMFVAVTQTGEEVGEIGKMTHWLADSGEEELDRCLTTVTSMVEPIVMFAMGGMVALMILATMLPLSKALEAF